MVDLQIKFEKQRRTSRLDVVEKIQARLLKKIAVELPSSIWRSHLGQTNTALAELAHIIESVPGLGKITSAGIMATMPNWARPAQCRRGLLGGDLTTTIAANGVVTAHQGRTPQGPQPFYMPCHGSCDPAQPRAQGVRRSPDCQGKGAEGCAHRRHAQAHRHPQHHDRATPKMGRQPLQSEHPARLPPSACPA